ncbi:MAG TPA: DUF2771 domain-containing protein [Streptomyces sp.]|nr:DUF2771 domain-containing protein [Streptomyces sp.]
MTNATSGSRRRLRTATALGAVSLGLLALSACQKPTPLTTVTVNGDSVHTQAACYNDGKAIPNDKLKDCLSKKPDVSVEVAQGDRVRVGVEPDVADNGWVLYGSQQQEAFHTTYQSFSGDAFFQSMQGQAPTDSSQLTVLELKDKKVTGVWVVKLNRA